MNCTAYLCSSFFFVWDETVSGTARSNTENELHSFSLLLIFVWGKTASGTAMRNIAELSSLFSVLLLAVPEAVSSHTKTRSRSAVQSILSLAPLCPRGSLVPYQSEEHQFCGALLTERTVCGMPSCTIKKCLILRVSTLHLSSLAPQG